MYRELKENIVNERNKAKQQIKESIKNHPTIESIVDDKNQQQLNSSLWVWIFLRDTNKEHTKKSVNFFFFYTHYKTEEDRHRFHVHIW